MSVSIKEILDPALIVLTTSPPRDPVRIQIDINNRKTESKAETKARDIDIEVTLSGDFLPSILMNMILADLSPQDNRANR